MRIFAIYDHRSRNPRAVKEGWSWLGFLLPIPYLFANILWLEGALALILFVFVRHLLYNLAWSSASDPASLYHFFQLLLHMAIGAIVGLKSPDWVKEKLRTRGYSYLGTVEAKNFRDALQKRLEDDYAPQ